MKEGETIHHMFTKLSSIKNELRSLGEPISMSKQVRKVLQILPKSWESKVDAITEAKDLKVLTIDALIGNLKTHKMNRNHDLSKKEVKKDKSLVLKYKSDEDSSDDDMSYLINRFQKIVGKNKGFRRGTNGPRNATQNIPTTSVEKLYTLLESVLYSKLQTRNIKNQEVTKRREGTWYSVKMIAKLLLTMWSKRLLLYGETLQVTQKILMNQMICQWWWFMKRKPYSMRCFLSWLIQKMKMMSTR